MPVAATATAAASAAISTLPVLQWGENTNYLHDTSCIYLLQQICNSLHVAKQYCGEISIFFIEKVINH